MLIKRTALVLIALLISIPLLSACGSEGDGSATESVTDEITTPAASAPSRTALVVDGKAQYRLIRPDICSESQMALAQRLYTALCETTGSAVVYKTDWVKSADLIDSNEKEILFGVTNRPETAEVMEQVGYLGWGVVLLENKIVICAGTDAGLGTAVDYFIGTVLASLTPETGSDGVKTEYISGGFTVEGKLTLSEPYIYKTPLFEGLSGTAPLAAPKQLDEIISSYYNAGGRLMSIAHRGDWRNYPENSLEAIQSCIDAGVDIVEIDLRKTSDGVWVLCHDEKVDRTTTGSGKVTELTYEQIQKLYLKSGKGGNSSKPTRVRMPTFEQVLEICRGKVLLNLDKAWEYRDEIYDIAVKYDCLDICMFKGGNAADWSAQLKSAGKKLPLICGSYWSDNLDGFNSYIDRLKGLGESIESGFTAFGMAPSQASVWKRAGDAGIRGVMLTLSASYSGGIADDQTGWSTLTDLGISVIMTEYPLNLAAYIENISAPRDATKPIRAENFNSHKGLALSSSDRPRADRTVKDIQAGDYAVYKSIDLGDGCGTFVVYARGLCEGATLALRFDSPDGEVAALIKVSKDTGFVQYAADFGMVSGIHDIYLSFEGGAGDLMTLEYLTFVK